MNDPTLGRTLLTLLKSYPASNPFWLARLAGRPERDVRRVLEALEGWGFVKQDSGRWTLAPRGREALRPAQSHRPGSVTRYRPITKRKVS